MQILCLESRTEGAVKSSSVWYVPKTVKNLNSEKIVRKLKESNNEENNDNWRKY